MEEEFLISFRQREVVTIFPEKVENWEISTRVLYIRIS